jgi:CRISPR-associated endonuclease/helicase Cas3
MTNSKLIPARMLAKSVPRGEPIPPSALLPNHLMDVRASACAVLDASGDAQLDCLGLQPDLWRERLKRIVQLAAAVHDLGKANDHFQTMIQYDRTQQQGMRHEWASYLMLLDSQFRHWLTTAIPEKEDYAIVLWAVCGHHREIPPTRSARGSEMVVFWSHPDLRSACKWIADDFDLADPPLRDDETWKLTAGTFGNVFSTIQKGLQRETLIWDSMSATCRRFTAVCKACLIAADVAGSALAKRLTPQRRQRWVKAALRIRPTPEQILTLVRERLDGKPLRPFQREVANPENRVVLVRAGCGTGKTAAAYFRAATKWPGRRLYFCYPTTGTATEGFRGYLFDSETRRSKINARLFHGRATVDREMILNHRGDEDPFEVEARAESLEAWSTPIACCTADTVLGLLQNHRRGLFGWPALSQSAFIFDEIHAYPDSLFAALLRFIGSLRNVPVLLMTASLPAARREAITSCLAASGERLAEVAGPADLESLPRYRLETGASPGQRARAEWAAGGKILWVCNTVDRAMRAADGLHDLCPLVYHSRFRYEDRVSQHSAVVRAFEACCNKAAIAICTQVAEMSLDLSATLLVMDLAPVPAMIQRLGRLNRWARPPRTNEPPASAMPFIVIEPTRSDGTIANAPYDPNEYGEWWTVSRKWLATLADGEISQADLAAKWQSLDSGNSPSAGGSAWLDGGPVTGVGDLREPSPGLTVILEGRDTEDVVAGCKSAVQVSLPMPPAPGRSWQSWPRVRGWLVAPLTAIKYSRGRGGEWA